MELNLTESTTPEQSYRIDFFGKGSEYFSIMIVNWLLTLVTLGLYYPWARAKKLQYIYSQTALNQERFHFSGTGNEMFRGFIKVILFYIGILGLYLLILYAAEAPLLAFLVLYLTILLIIPFAIHGAFRYRMSRTSYRGIRFGYRGDRDELVPNFYKWVLFTILSLGIYGAWLHMNTRRYTHSNIRYGNVKFSNQCYGDEWFILNLKGYFFTLFTLGIYLFWWQKEIFNYYVENMRMSHGVQKVKCYSLATGGGFFELLMGNLLITVFTLGLGKAWADMRTQKFMCDNIVLKGNINLDEINQTEEEYTNAFGEDVMDLFEIDLA